MNDLEMLRNDTELLEQLGEAQSAEEIAALVRAKGYEVTDENAQAAFAYKTGDCELNEEMLDHVSGGLVLEFVTACYIIGTIAAYGTAYAMSRETSSWNKKKGKK